VTGVGLPAVSALEAPMRSFGMVLLVLFLASSSGTAFAQSNDVAYFCVSEVAGGLWYNEKIKKWEGTSFRATVKFLVEMSFAYSWVKQNEHVSDYKVTVTRSGENAVLPCLSHITKEKTVTVGDNYRTIFCTIGLQDYVFNFQTNRFLAIHLYGYVAGDDNNDNPGIEAGTCTKID
jgi:hypothetical protein